MPFGSCFPPSGVDCRARCSQAGHAAQRNTLSAQHEQRVALMTATCADYDASLQLLHKHMVELDALRKDEALGSLVE